MGEQLRTRRVRRAAAGAAVATVAVLVGAVTTAGATKPDADGVHKVTICHATNSDSNPYVVITVDYSAANGSLGKGKGDHTGHTGPVWSTGLKDAGVKWGDIIPPYTYSKGSFPGLNWDAAGQAIHDAGCNGGGGGGGTTGGDTTGGDTTGGDTTGGDTTGGTSG